MREYSHTSRWMGKSRTDCSVEFEERLMVLALVEEGGVMKRGRKGRRQTSRWMSL